MTVIQISQMRRTSNQGEANLTMFSASLSSSVAPYVSQYSGVGVGWMTCVR